MKLGAPGFSFGLKLIGSRLQSLIEGSWVVGIRVWDVPPLYRGVLSSLLRTVRIAGNIQSLGFKAWGLGPGPSWAPEEDFRIFEVLWFGV